MKKPKNEPKNEHETQAPVATATEALATTPVETEAPVEAPPTPTELATTSTELANAETQELVDDGVTCTHLVPILPHKAKTFRRLYVASDADYEAARAALSPAAQERYDELRERMSAESAFETGTRGFRPQHIKLRQGTTNDENCPEMCDAGGLYTSDGIVLTAPTEQRAKKSGVSTSIYAVLIAGWTGRALFAPRVNSKVVPLAEFGDAKTDSPYCRSMDSLVGAPVKQVHGIGKCPECPYRPWKTPGEPNLCNESVSAVFVLLKKNADGTFVCFDGLYEMTFSKSAVPTGKHIRSLAEKGKEPWERVMKLSVREEKGKEGVYFVPEAAYETSEENGRPVTVSRADAVMLKLLHNEILVRYYYPNLAAIYMREARVRAGGASADAERAKTDMSEVERRAALAAGDASRPSTDMRDANV